MNQCLIACIAEQRLYFFTEQGVYFWPISSALKGVGNLKNSNQTPLGWHLIRAKIGQDSPIYSVFKARRPTGEICDLASADKNRDWILSRILWLSGMQKGVNRLGHCDSMQRYIYIHGTNEEDLLGTAASHGCLRMQNDDVIELFARVNSGCPILITENNAVDCLANLPTEMQNVNANYQKQKTMLNQLFTDKNLTAFSKELEGAC
ncbi:L,D-transpeptidase [Thiomicrorhabdus sp. 6S2-11]|uniref:L,D-transpeptidase n=1 Tax=Thiomicrorhabdus marina TaxID=2818442 RepID=A0ABS3Q2Z7_9GAMM|nr:L,D-transpeptidase [Thiomicrorhabdus marina]MBO1926712.1 L,D-transpeptidase [Thiomicrorhabdus marina]